MTASATAKLRRRAERAEDIAIGMGFLLLKLQGQYGADFGVGMREQVAQAIGHYRELVRARSARAHAAELNTQAAARSA